jgi:hypothetical protein
LKKGKNIGINKTYHNKLGTMGAEDWYRNTTWDKTIEADFEARLKRSRGASNKAQYLRIQASYLLDSPDNSNQLVGLRLMERVIKDFPTEEFTTIFAHEEIGDYFLKQGDLDIAEQQFRVVTDFYLKKQSRSGTSGIADLKLAEIILASNQAVKFEEAYKICKEHPVGELFWNSYKFYYSALMARLCDKMTKKEEARNFAATAISLSKIKDPQSPAQKRIGLINATNIQLQILEQIANG